MFTLSNWAGSFPIALRSYSTAHVLPFVRVDRRLACTGRRAFVRLQVTAPLGVVRVAAADARDGHGDVLPADGLRSQYVDVRTTWVAQQERAGESRQSIIEGSAQSPVVTCALPLVPSSW